MMRQRGWMLGAALGVKRGDPRLAELADATAYGVVVHSRGTVVVDYQTADLDRIGRKAATVDERAAIRIVKREGSVVSGTAEQRRPLLCDADMTVLATVDGEDAGALMDAVGAPVFPLYLGRMSCPPGRRIGEGVMTALSLDTALDAVKAEFDGVLYRPVAGLVDGLIVSVPGRNRAPVLFSVIA